MMNTTCNMLNNDRGSTIIIAVLVLVFLSIIGISATSTSMFESQTIGNEHNYQIDFYMADSGVDHAAVWIESRGVVPNTVNPDDAQTVKNWGDAPSGDPDQVEDITWVIGQGYNPDYAFASSALPGLDYTRPAALWFHIDAMADSAVAGSGPSYREFTYMVDSQAGEPDSPTQRIQTRLVKVYKVGY